jgi:5'-3' exoribonuclease 1
MGIPSYFSYIVKNHSNIIKKYDNHKKDEKNEKNENTMQINNFYLDCNSIIYDAVHTIDFTKLVDSDVNTIINSVIKKIDEYIEIIQPTDNLIIAFDGVAPVAKLEQQRQRRYKSLYQSQISKSIFKNSKPDPWNTTCITPGTVFMKKLNDKIKKRYSDNKDKKDKKDNDEKYNIKKIIVSTSDTCGEGEHKIFDYIRDFPEEHVTNKTVIYGLDADLIMLSINHLPISKNIYLFRETPEFIKSINSELEPNETYLMDIPELAKIITLNMNNNEPLTSETHHNRIYDYIFICFFLGNDFMPHFPSINIRTGGVDKMINAYKATIGGTNDNLTDGKKIYWKNVRKMVKFLVDTEENNFKQETKVRDKREKYRLPDETAEDKFKKFDSIPTYERDLEKYINPYNNNWQTRYYKCLFNVDINDDIKKEICTNYLQGLEWTMKYYTTGCPDWRWCYKYNYPPLLCDLIHYIPYFDTEFIENKKPEPVTEFVQLCYVLPRQSLQMLPEDIYNKLMKEHNDWYKSDCEFVWAYCRYFWEAHVQLPDININELEKFIKAITLLEN